MKQTLSIKNIEQTKYFTKHMSINIEGMLRNYGTPGKKAYRSMEGLFMDNGREMTDQEARVYLHNCQVKGWKIIPMGGEGSCKGFDHFGGGCPGHPITEQEYKKRNQS